MNNKKGFTTIEMLVALMFVTVIMGTVIYIPFQIYEQNARNQEFTDETHSISLLKRAIYYDILSEEVKIENNETLNIGGHIYVFSESEGVTRDGKQVANANFDFNLDANKLTLSNNRFDLVFYTNTSFRGHEINETN